MPIATILKGLKWVGIAGIFVGILYGLNKVYQYHLDQIDKAVVTAELKTAERLDQAAELREAELRELARLDREAIEVELRIERDKTKDLERMLLIDHDLDRLLQNKPGLILPRVNKGTEDYFNELGEVTQ